MRKVGPPGVHILAGQKSGSSVSTKPFVAKNNPNPNLQKKKKKKTTPPRNHTADPTRLVEKNWGFFLISRGPEDR